MSFVRQGSPEPIEQCQYILDDAQNIICECGGRIGRISHSVVESADGDMMLSINGMKCPKCGKEVSSKGVEE